MSGHESFSVIRGDDSTCCPSFDAYIDMVHSGKVTNDYYMTAVAGLTWARRQFDCV